MTRLEPGNRKFLLLDRKVLDRNTERPGRGSPAVCVAEVNDSGETLRKVWGYNARSGASSPVELYVFPRGDQFQKEYGAAWSTTGEVILDDLDTTQPAPPAAPMKPAKPATPKPVKVKH